MSRALAIALGPLVLAQARRLTRTVPRLAEAGGPRTGSSPRSSPGSRPLRLAVIGDSTAVGTGVARLEDALPGALARRLSADSVGHDTVGHDEGGRGVEWIAIGHSGDTAGEVLATFGDEIETAVSDLSVVLVGWNDAMRLRSRRAFRRDLRALVDRIRRGSPAGSVVVVAPPQFGRFAVLPQPLRAVLGSHARGLERVARDVAHDTGAMFAPGFDGDSVASDGFHPDATGYERLAADVLSVVNSPRKRN